MDHPADMRAAIDRYCAVVQSRDVDAYVALFTPDAVQADPASAPPHIGHEAIGAFWRSVVEGSTAVEFQANRVHTCGTSAAIEFAVTISLPTGPMHIEGIEVFTFADDGRIQEVRAYWDEADVSVLAP